MDKIDETTHYKKKYRDATPEEIAQFNRDADEAERLHFGSVNAGEPEKKKHHRAATPEEMAEHKRLADGADRYYFGFSIDGEPQIEAEATNESGDEGKPSNQGA